MKFLILLFSFFIATFSLIGQDDQVAAMNVSFEKYRTALLAKEYQDVVAMLHPQIVEMGGGEAYMIEDIERDLITYEGIGIKLLDLKSKQPSVIVSAGDELHAMLPVEILMETPSDTTSEISYFLAASKDQGKSWFFVDMRKQDEESIKVFLPNYNNRLNFFLKQKD